MADVKTGSEATEIAVTFLGKFYSFPQPSKATKQDDTWVLEVDVGLGRRRTAKVKVDAKTGEIIEYEVSQ